MQLPASKTWKKLSYYRKIFGYGFVCLILASLVGLGVVTLYFLGSESKAEHQFQKEGKFLLSLSWDEVLSQSTDQLNAHLNTIKDTFELKSLQLFNLDYTFRASATQTKWTVLPRPYQQEGTYLLEGAWANLVLITIDNKPIAYLWLSKQKPSFESYLHQVKIPLAAGLLSLLLILVLFWVLHTKFLVKTINQWYASKEKSSGTMIASWFTYLAVTNNFGPFRVPLLKFLSDLRECEKGFKFKVLQLQGAILGSQLVDFYWAIDKDRITFDKSLKDLLGYHANEGVLTLEEWVLKIHPDDLEHFQNTLSMHLKNDSDYFEAKFRMLDARAEYLWVLGRGRVLERDKQNQPKVMAGTLCDITEKKMREDTLELIYDAFNNTAEAVVVTDHNLRIIQCNKAFCQVTQYSLEETKNKSIEFLYSNQHPPAFFTNIRRTLEIEHRWQGEIVQQKKNGEEYPTLLTLSTMSDVEGKTLHYVAMFVDQTAQSQQKNELEFLASFDSLTHLMNRDFFKKHVERTLHISKQAHESAALMIIGIDNFKLINDTFSHGVGDELLKQAANRLKVAMPANGQLARIGGDEFALFLESYSEKESLQLIANDLLESLHPAFKIDDHEIVISACIGISLYPDDADTMETLLMNADTALLHAKRHERNSYQFFVYAMNEEAQERQRIESLLRLALEIHEFELFYQPKVDIKTGLVIGAEALLRWNQRELGLISPEKFIPIAEDTGLIIPISEWVFRQACMQGQLWQQLGWTHFSIAVNVSGNHFKRDDFAEFMQKILYETGFPAHCLDLEITEGALVADIEHCILILKVLKSMGVTLSVDDFGTGYSSLSYLRKFPVDTLKVDKSFVQNMMTNPEDANITTAVIAMAKGLKLKTVAEGVENIEQLNVLKQLECDYVQGFYYSKAIPPEEFEVFYNQQNQKAKASQG